jgi:predicted alpha/beta-fold hydrolase
MGVGWGYGANMLTKYLVEVGESTPLTAAVCIDNPFDLQEATRSFPHHIALDQKLTAGLVDILRANKVVITDHHCPPKKMSPFLPCPFICTQSPLRWACAYIIH